MSNKEEKVSAPIPDDLPSIRRFSPVHARTMDGKCSGACAETVSGDFVTYADYKERIARLTEEVRDLREALRPVSDEEWKRAFHIQDSVGLYMPRHEIDALLAARADAQGATK